MGTTTGWWKRVRWEALIGLVPIMCGGDGEGDNVWTSDTLTTVPGGIDETGQGEGDDADDGVLDLGSADDGGGGGVNECDEVITMADVGPRDQDIIFAIDTSGSMIQEAAFVQAQMNSFSIQISAANVEARIILLAEYPPIFGPGICIDPPLGSGGCPTQDSNPPEFLHVPDSDIASSNALTELVAHYPNYAPFIRPTALTHVVVVTDDNSAISAADFTASFSALSPHLSSFIFHGIVSSDDPDAACAAGTACCTLAANQGTVYQELIMQTGGVEGNLCDQQFQPVFQAVAAQVIEGASLACTYTIPTPPDGETFDKDQVNVEFDDGMGGTLEIGRVDDPALCADVSDGWYYDDPDNPQLINVCPQTCEKIQGFAQARVAIKFGCETIPAG